jgi:hypothetical protein
VNVATHRPYADIAIDEQDCRHRADVTRGLPGATRLSDTTAQQIPVAVTAFDEFEKESRYSNVPSRRAAPNAHLPARCESIRQRPRATSQTIRIGRGERQSVASTHGNGKADQPDDRYVRSSVAQTAPRPGRPADRFRGGSTHHAR